MWFKPSWAAWAMVFLALGLTIFGSFQHAMVLVLVAIFIVLTHIYILLYTKLK